MQVAPHGLMYLFTRRAYSGPCNALDRGKEKHIRFRLEPQESSHRGQPLWRAGGFDRTDDRDRQNRIDSRIGVPKSYRAVWIAVQHGSESVLEGHSNRNLSVRSDTSWLSQMNDQIEILCCREISKQSQAWLACGCPRPFCMDLPQVRPKCRGREPTDCRQEHFSDSFVELEVEYLCFRYLDCEVTFLDYREQPGNTHPRMDGESIDQ